MDKDEDEGEAAVHLDELVLNIYRKYRIDVDPNDPIFGILMMVAQAIILDDEERLNKLEGRFGQIIDESESDIKADKEAAIGEFSRFAAGQLSELERRMDKLIQDGITAQDNLLKRQKKESSKSGVQGLSSTDLLLLWCTFAASLMSVSIMFVFLFVG